MARQTNEERNKRRKARYRERMREARNTKGILNLGIVMDRSVHGLSYRKIAEKWGVSKGCIQRIIQHSQ